MDDNTPDWQLQALAAQFKTPLLQIAHLARAGGTQDLYDIQIVTSLALKMAEAYTGYNQQTRLILEPLTAGSVLYDAAGELDAIAKLYQCSLQVRVHHAQRPILGHRQTLKDMLVLLASGVMQSLPEESNRQLLLGAHRSAHGTVLGVFGQQTGFSQQSLSQLRQLQGKADQASPALLGGAAAIGLADRLSTLLQAPLKAYKQQQAGGIGSLLPLSKQLQLVGS